ncbi:hypothetical protein [Leifsonia sp. 2MCAF36]|uniref:hypothetical protein n=1 Tax=Leifsonia sp. 2MCAF36 TaxID=3232988 RepID=UPI003F9E6C35
MDLESIAMLLSGALAFLGGVAIILFRDQVARKNKENIEAKLGKLFPGFADHSTPGRMVPVGAAAILIGIALMVNGTTR